MECPARIPAIAEALLARTPAIITRNDDECREFIKAVAEQVRFELGPAYGLKAAGPGRPQGPSQIAYLGEPAFGGWRLIDLASTKDARILTNPPWQEFRDQVFIAVEPLDHLHTTGVPAPTMPGPAPTMPIDLPALVAHLEQRIELLEVELRQVQITSQNHADDIEMMEHRRYVAKTWFGRIVSVPE